MALLTSRKDWELGMDTSVRPFNFSYYGQTQSYLTTEIAYTAVKGKRREDITEEVLKYVYGKMGLSHLSGGLIIIIRENIHVPDYPMSSEAAWHQGAQQDRDNLYQGPAKNEEEKPIEKPNLKLLLL
jgi:hypothetical protein